jgi:hypothetical protein
MLQQWAGAVGRARFLVFFQKLWRGTAMLTKVLTQRRKSYAVDACLTSSKTQQPLQGWGNGSLQKTQLAQATEASLR